MPLTDVTELGYPHVLINLAAVVVIALLLGTVLRVLDPRLRLGSPAAPEVAAAVVPRPRSGAEPVTHQEN